MEIMKFLFKGKFLYFVKSKKGKKWEQVDSEEIYFLLKKQNKKTINTVIYSKIIL